MSFHLVELTILGLLLIPAAISAALIARRIAGHSPDSHDHPQRKRILDFWIGVCMSILAGGSLSVYMLIFSVNSGCHYPVEATVRTELHQLKQAIADCRMATGSTPTNVSELKMLFGTYYEPDELVKQGKTRW